MSNNLSSLRFLSNLSASSVLPDHLGFYRIPMDSSVEYNSPTEPLHFRADISKRKTSEVAMKKRTLILIIVLGPVCALIIGLLIGYKAIPRPEENEYVDNKKIANDISDKLLNEMKAENIKNNLRVLSEKVHLAGSNQEEAVLVDFLHQRWKQQLDKVEIISYDVMLSMPNGSDPNYVAMVDGNGVQSDRSLSFEPKAAEYENFTTIGVSFNAYGDAGHVEGQLVFVNYGRKVDFDTLNKTIGVDVTGKICIAKYGRVFRGDKAENAEKYGCSGLIIYTDPADYGDKRNVSDTFPHSWWMPHSGVQRGSLFLKDGDPLTPFYPSIDSAYRIPENETNLPRIPVQPISSDDAYKYLSKLGGVDAPDDWQGGLNLTYKVGGLMKEEFKTSKVVLHVSNYRPRKVIKNVIGYILGKEEPDRFVIIGNHRDAWVFGAVDPSSGTAVMMEIARAMGKYLKSGEWRPRRTIIFCSWGAEEYGLIGSIEWVEEMEKKLMMQAVTYLNVDIAVQGNTTFRAHGTPNLRSVLYDVAKKIANPDQNEISQNRPTVYDTWKLKYADEQNKSRPFVGPLGSGSDYMMFVQKTGVSSVDMRYTFDEINLRLSSYPIYHSAHETIEYFEKFLDPNYAFSLSVAQLWGELTRKIADDAVIPFNPVEYALEVERMVDSMNKTESAVLRSHGITLNYLYDAVEMFLQSAIKLNQAVTSLNDSRQLDVRRVNDKLMYLDRSFLDFNGLPGRKWLRHVVYAPSIHNSYHGVGFSGFLDAVCDAKVSGDFEVVKQQLSVITFHLLSAAKMLESP